jgi:probable rRNA maturation factor
MYAIYTAVLRAVLPCAREKITIFRDTPSYLQLVSITVDLQNDGALSGIPTSEHFSRWILAALRKPFANFEQTVRVVDESESQALNLQYRGKDKPTNILSFPAEIPHIDYQCLGDLVVCAPLVVSEASDQNKELAAHWAHLIIHGMLHLQGFDHETDQKAAKMEALEVEILSTLGYSNPYNNK